MREDTPLSHEETINVYERRKAEGYFGHKPWSIEEINILFNLHKEGRKWHEIAAEVGRTIGGVKGKASKIGLKNKRKRPRLDAWTAEDIRILKKEWRKGTSLEEIATMMNRSRDAVRGKRLKYNLPTRVVKPELKQEVQRKYDEGYSINELAKEYNMCGETLRLKLSRTNYRKQGLTDSEKEIIEDRFYDGCTGACIANRIRRNPSSVQLYIRQQDLNDDRQSLDAIVQDLHRHGLTVDQIATKLELPRQSILFAFKRNRRKPHE